MTPSPSPTPPRPATTHHNPGDHPTPTSERENSKAMWWVIGMVALAIVAVLGFNILGPGGDASRSGERPPAATSEGMAPSAPNASSPAQAGTQGPAQAQPHSADTPVDASRNTMGAPAGATPPAAGSPAQASGSSTSVAVPMPATAPASEVPASPASR